MSIITIIFTQDRKHKHTKPGRMESSGMLHRVALVKTDVSEELSASFIGVTRIGELGPKLAVISK
jgi:hypothetical protein